MMASVFVLLILGILATMFKQRRLAILLFLATLIVALIIFVLHMTDPIKINL